MNLFRIKEHSFIARLAAKKLKSKNVAMVVGSTIHLWGVSKVQFLADERWVRHELKHIEQYRRYGLVKFLYKYLLQTAKHGYYNSPIEREARAAEKDTEILAKFILKDRNSGKV